MSYLCALRSTKVIGQAMAVTLLALSAICARADESRDPLPNCILGGDIVSVDVSSVSRRDIIKEIFGGKIAVDWQDAAFADQIVNRRIRGTCEVLLAGILEPSNYSIAYDREGATYRLTRIHVSKGHLQQTDAMPMNADGRSKSASRKFSELHRLSATPAFQKRLRSQMTERLRAARAVPSTP